MVTGSPGLGKSLTVKTVLNSSTCKIIQINSNLMKNFKDIQQYIYEQIFGKKSQRLVTTQTLMR